MLLNKKLTVGLAIVALVGFSIATNIIVNKRWAMDTGYLGNGLANRIY